MSGRDGTGYRAITYIYETPRILLENVGAMMQVSGGASWQEHETTNSILTYEPQSPRSLALMRFLIVASHGQWRSACLKMSCDGRRGAHVVGR
jgi:hypothetical protein